MNVWDEGETVVMTFTIVDPTSKLAPIDPETGFTLVDPSAVFLAYAISATETGVSGAPVVFTYGTGAVPGTGILGRVSQGVYQVWVDSTDQPGYWTYRGYSLGVGQSTARDKLYVRPKPF